MSLAPQGSGLGGAILTAVAALAIIAANANDYDMLVVGVIRTVVSRLACLAKGCLVRSDLRLTNVAESAARSTDGFDNPNNQTGTCPQTTF